MEWAGARMPMTVKQSVQRLVRIANGTKLAREESGICLVILWHGTIPSYRGHSDHNNPFGKGKAITFNSVEIKIFDACLLGFQSPY